MGNNPGGTVIVDELECRKTDSLIIMATRLIKNVLNNIRYYRIMKKYRLESQRKSPKPSYNQLSSYYKGNTIVVGCSCGNAKVSREWDVDLGAYYYIYECEKCHYYWEGPIYCEVNSEM